MPTARGEELLAWPVLAAIVLTALNDHLFKALWPGPLTWKISDFAGLFFFPFLVTAITGRIGWILPAAIATGAAFTVLKFTGLAIGPFRIAADPTDLVALVSLAAAVLYARRRWPCDAR